MSEDCQNTHKGLCDNRENGINYRTVHTALNVPVIRGRKRNHFHSKQKIHDRHKPARDFFRWEYSNVSKFLMNEERDPNEVLRDSLLWEEVMIWWFFDHRKQSSPCLSVSTKTTTLLVLTWSGNDEQSWEFSLCRLWRKLSTKKKARSREHSFHFIVIFSSFFVIECSILWIQSNVEIML